MTVAERWKTRAPNLAEWLEASVLRLVTAILSEIDDDWTNGRIYLNP